MTEKYRVINGSHPQLFIFLLLLALLPVQAQKSTNTAAPIFRRTLSGYESWFVESPKRDLAVAGLAHQGPVVLLERSTGLVLRELSRDSAAFGAVFSGDQELVFVAARYALRVYEAATGHLLTVFGIEIDGPDLKADGRVLYLRSRVAGAEGVFRLDTRDSLARDAWRLERLPALPNGIALGDGRSVPADQLEGILPEDLTHTFLRAMPPFFARQDSVVFLAKGAVVFFNRGNGRPTRILELEEAKPELFAMDYYERNGIAYAPKGSDHYVYLWQLDKTADPAVQRASRSYRVPLHPVRMVLSDKAKEAWMSGFRGGRDAGGGMMIENVDAAGLLDLETGAWVEVSEEEAPSWARDRASGTVADIPEPGRMYYRVLEHGVLEAGNQASDEPLVFMRVDERGDWAAFTPDGRWDCSPGAPGSLLFMSDGLRTWKPDPAQDKGFTPGLVETLTKDYESIHLTVAMERGDGARDRVGEEAVILVTVDKPVWLRLYHVEESGQAQLIWPNEYDRGQWIEPGTNLRFPPPEKRYSFQVTLPGGVETILAFASTDHFMPDDPNLPFTGKPDPGFQIKRGYEKPEYYPSAFATARTSYTVPE